MTQNHQENRLILASGSPRRRQLLTQLGVPFEVVVADIDETPQPGERPLDLVRRLALAKARAVDGEPVLAADTIVDCDGEVFGQPRDVEDATRMLRRLAGRTHRVHTGVALRVAGAEQVAVVTTLVTMVPITPGALEWYLATGEPFDKAGAYAIQGAGAVLVEGIRGSVSNVVGLPLTTVADLLRRHCGWRPG
ncbi:MAG: Maf family protein [Ilumatobacteraceae bacterium]